MPYYSKIIGASSPRLRGGALAEAALAVIEQNPEKWDQAVSMCGSQGCFMGHVVFIGLGMSTEEDFDWWAMGFGGASVMGTAQELLGWSYQDADFIFSKMTDDFEELAWHVREIVSHTHLMYP